MFFITLLSLITTLFSLMYLFFQLFNKYIFRDTINNFNLKIMISSSCVILFWLLTYSLNIVYERLQNPHVKDGVEEYSGTLGDLIGGVLNPVLGLFGILVGALAFYAQYMANKQVQEQFEKQESKDYIQNFENKLFKLIEFQNQIVQNIDIDISIFNDDKINEIISENPLINIKYNTFHQTYFDDVGGLNFKELEIKSRDSFKFIFELIDNILSMSNQLHEKISNPILNENNALDDEDDVYNEHFDIFRINFENLPVTYNDLIINDYFLSIYKTIFLKLNIDLGHYYRNLYRIFKIIDEANFSKNKVYDEKLKYEYSSIVRSQLSDYEIYFLFYNGLSEYGFSKFKKLIEKFSLLKIIPIDNEEYEFYRYKDLYHPKAFMN